METQCDTAPAAAKQADLAWTIKPLLGAIIILAIVAAVVPAERTELQEYLWALIFIMAAILAIVLAFMAAKAIVAIALTHVAILLILLAWITQRAAVGHNDSILDLLQIWKTWCAS